MNFDFTKEKEYKKLLRNFYIPNEPTYPERFNRLEKSIKIWNGTKMSEVIGQIPTNLNLSWDDIEFKIENDDYYECDNCYLVYYRSETDDELATRVKAYEIALKNHKKWLKENAVKIALYNEAKEFEKWEKENKEIKAKLLKEEKLKEAKAKALKKITDPSIIELINKCTDIDSVQLVTKLKLG